MKILDIHEFLRFVCVGLVATSGNLLAVALVRKSCSFDTTLTIGVMTGMVLSFLLSKFFAFRSRSMHFAPGELWRFLFVYAISAGCYWVVSHRAKPIAAMYLGERFAEYVAILVGCCTMAVVSYVGHRFFTYRRAVQVAHDADSYKYDHITG